MSKPHIVFLDQGSLGADVDLSSLHETARSNGYQYQGFEHTNAEQMPERIGCARVIISNKCALDAEALAEKNTPALKLILVAATGYNIIDINACARRGIAVCNVKNYATEAVAQHTIALILALSNRIWANDNNCHSGKWSASQHFCLLDNVPQDLADMGVGIVGFGTIGQRVAELLRAFNARVYIAARDHNDRREQRIALDDMLDKIDVLSLHCPLTPATHHLIGERELALMPAHALLINTSRGPLVDEDALEKALKNNEIGGAGLDVLAHEPPRPEHPLLKCPSDRLILSPHIAWASSASRAQLVAGLAEHFSSYIHQRPLDTVTVSN